VFDWHQFHRNDARPPAVVDPRRRMTISLAGFVLLLAVVFGRAVQLEITQGAAFRAEAARPIRRQTDLPAPRGRILARDGAVLAADREIASLAVPYRVIENPANPQWLRQAARKRLTRAQRRDATRLAEEETRVQAENADLQRRLAELCGMRAEQWNARAAEIQSRVQRIAAAANRNQPESPIIVAEELADPIVVEDVGPAVVEELAKHGERYLGAHVVRHLRRDYPCGALAAHVIGHLGRGKGDSPIFMASDEPVGRMGVERQYEAALGGRPGVAVELTDHGGRLLRAFHESEPEPGSDVVLTLDVNLQRAAEELLDSALRRRAMQADDPEPAGGAIAVMDVHDGELLAMASAPRFEPGVFVRGTSAEREAVLHDSAHPLLDRTIRMALPPGSVFKTLTAIALLEAGSLDPQKPFTCRGYLKRPDRQRCEIYVHHGVGHGEVTLADALAQSCNVYFFHHAAELPPGAMADWAGRLGFGRPTGIDLPGEAAGILPTPETIAKLEGHAWHASDTQSMAIGQGALTATPLQVLRMMAAVSNGGRLVSPHVVQAVTRGRLPTCQGATGILPVFQPGTGKMPVAPDGKMPVAPPQPIDGLKAATLAAVAEGLRRVVADPKGTAHGSVAIDSVPIAGKTGTASVGEGRADHAWFAGYVPADSPRYALVVVLEHAGDAAATAGPVAKRLVLKMAELEMVPRL
jgi:penicillin-binding protein 2